MVTKTMTGTFTKAAGGPEGIVEAIVNTTNILDVQGDVIVPGAWLSAIGTPDRVRVTRDHIHSAVGIIGKTLQLKELMPGDPRIPEDLAARGAGVLYAKAQLNLSKPAGREAFDDLAGGFVAEWSVGFDIADGGEEHVNDVRYIRKIRNLYEYSAVFRGAAPGTRTMVAKCDQCNPVWSKKGLKKARMGSAALERALAQVAVDAVALSTELDFGGIEPMYAPGHPPVHGAGESYWGPIVKAEPTPAAPVEKGPQGKTIYYISPHVSTHNPNWEPGPELPYYDPRMR